MPQQVQSEIESIIQKARPTNRDLVRRDILQVLQLPTTHLILKSAEYYYNDGTSKELLCLTGTVACNYRSNRYNIPVEVWLQQDHPQIPPLAYVKPTIDMYISTTTQDVKPDGTIIIPYLRTWRHPTNDLSTLFKTMSEVFSRTPPVYSSSSTTPYPVNPTMTMPIPNINQPMIYQNSNWLNQPTNNSIVNSYSTTNPIPHEIYRDSLETALIEKIRDRLDELTSVNRIQIDSLTKDQFELTNGQRSIQNQLDSIQVELFQGQNYLKNLKEKLSNLSKSNSMKFDKSNEDRVRDDVLIFPAPIYKQLFRCYAEEHAIQDLLFYLSEGVERKSINLDIYLKHVRELSRRQFLLRATMRKCRQISGLPVK